MISKLIQIKSKRAKERKRRILRRKIDDTRNVNEHCHEKGKSGKKKIMSKLYMDFIPSRTILLLLHIVNFQVAIASGGREDEVYPMLLLRKIWTVSREVHRIEMTITITLSQ